MTEVERIAALKDALRSARDNLAASRTFLRLGVSDRETMQKSIDRFSRIEQALIITIERDTGERV